METRSNQVLVGSVVLVLIAATALFLVWLSGATAGGVKSYDIFFKQSVDGLAKGTAVTFSGVPSGQITDIALWKDNPQFVRVRIQVKNDTPILQGTKAKIAAIGFTGVSQITLDGAVKGAPPITDPGPAGVPIIPAIPSGIAALLNQAPELLDRVSTLTERVGELLNDDNQNSLKGILKSVDKLSSSLADRGPEIAATLAETKVAIQQAGNAAEKFGKLADTVNGQSGPLITNLNATISSANSSMKTLDATLKDARPGVQSFSKQTLPEVAGLVRDLRVMAQSLSAVAAKIDQGGATSLISSPKLPDYKPRGGRR